MPHTAHWGSTRPGCLIFLVDQSAGMAGVLPPGSGASEQRLDHMAATILNKCITDLGMQCMKNVMISPRVEIAVIGYGGDSAAVAFDGSLAGRELVSITELMDNPLRLDTREVKTTKVDDAGNFREVVNQIEFPVWIDPAASGGTPMNAAVDHAGQIASEWVKDHMECHPPVVVNITDGVYTDADPRPMADYLKQICTNDGNLLMFNYHISTAPGNQISYPVHREELPPIDGAEMLFDMSSEMPDNWRHNANQLNGLDIRPHARGYMFLGSIDFFRWSPGEFGWNYSPQGE